ncbi:hypothetical protein [Glycomyces tarimensis]
MLKRRWPTEEELDHSLLLAAKWIRRHQIPNEPFWPVMAGGSEASLWGGTVDAVCAIVALRGCGAKVSAPLGDIDLHATARWIRSRQRKDGSFDSGEFGFAGAESTAWALIALHAASAGAKNRPVTVGLSFLESCVDQRNGSVSSVPGDTEPSRAMPCALTLWAFALWGHREDLRDKIVSYLLRSQDGESHGWGVTGFARPNPSTTAQVIVAFQAAGVPPEGFELAVEYLVGQQRDSGRWPNSIDEWSAPADRSSLQLANKCTNCGTAWGLLALARMEDHRSRSACLLAVHHLLERQSASGSNDVRGSWVLWDDGAQRHVWLTGQIVAALGAWRAGLPRKGIRRGGMRATNALLRVVDFALDRAPWILVIGLLVAVVALSSDSSETGIANWLVGDSAAFRQKLLTSGLTAAVIGAVSWVSSGIRNWWSNRKRR